MFKYHVLESHVQYSNLFWENNDRPLGMKLILPCKTQSNKKTGRKFRFFGNEIKTKSKFCFCYIVLCMIYFYYMFFVLHLIFWAFLATFCCQC